MLFGTQLGRIKHLTWSCKLFSVCLPFENILCSNSIYIFRDVSLVLDPKINITEAIVKYRNIHLNCKRVGTVLRGTRIGDQCATSDYGYCSLLSSIWTSYCLNLIIVWVASRSTKYKYTSLPSFPCQKNLNFLGLP